MSARHEPPCPPSRKTRGLCAAVLCGLLTRPGAQAYSRWGVYPPAWKARLAQREEPLSVSTPGGAGNPRCAAWYLGRQRWGGKRAPVGLVSAMVETSGEAPH